MKKMKSALILGALVTALGVSTAFAATSGADYDQNPHKMRDKLQQYINSEKGAGKFECNNGGPRQGMHKHQGFGKMQARGAEILASLTGRDATAIREEAKTSNKRISDMAKEAGVFEQFQAKRLEAAKEHLNKAVADGKIPQEKADQILKNIQEGKFQGPHGGMKKHQDMHKHAGMHKHQGFGQMQGRGAEILASLTGRDAAAIREEAKTSNKRISDMAKEAGVFEQFQAKRLEAAKENLNKAVADGKISQEKADQILKNIQEGKPMGPRDGGHKHMMKQGPRDGSCQNNG